jgi:hypothetical protein
MTDEGEDDFSFEGVLEIVLTYDMAGPEVGFQYSWPFTRDSKHNQ